MNRSSERCFGSVGAVLAAAILAGLAATAADVVDPREAIAHVGEHVTVCGKVVSATYASRSRGRPTFLNLDEPYPNHVFTIVIWGDDRTKFAARPEVAYRDRRVCVTGKVSVYRGRAQIVVREPDRIRVLEER